MLQVGLRNVRVTALGTRGVYKSQVSRLFGQCDAEAGNESKCPVQLMF